MEYRISRGDDENFLVTRYSDAGTEQAAEVLGRRPTKPRAQRLAESGAGRPLKWTNIGKGVYIGRRAE